MKLTRGKYAFLLTVVIAAYSAGASAQSAASSVGNPQQPSQVSEAPVDTPVVPETTVSTPGGYEALRVNGPTMNRTFFSPSLRYSHRLSGNTREADQGIEWDKTGNLGGTLEFERRAGRNFTTFTYGGVGRVYNDSGAGNSMHQVSFSESLSFGRVNVFLGNDFSYMSESNRFTGLEQLGQPVLEEPVLPDDSIIVNHAPRYSNASAGQVEYMIDRRNSLTFGGTYTMLLHRGDATGVNGNQFGGRVGFNRAISRRMSIGVNYNLTRFEFEDRAQEIDSHTFHFVISRQLSRAWTLQLAAGPELTNLGFGASGSSNSVRFSTSAVVLYMAGTRTLRASYTEGTRNGSGVMVGSHSQRADATFGTSLSRNWGVEVRAAYAHNSSFSEFSTAVEQGKFHSGAAGVRIRRQLGPQLQAFTTYNIQRQTQVGGCSGVACEELTTRHAIEFGIRYTFQPMRVR